MLNPPPTLKYFFLIHLYIHLLLLDYPLYYHHNYIVKKKKKVVKEEVVEPVKAEPIKKKKGGRPPKPLEEKLAKQVIRTEKIIYMPDSYQANDNTKKISDKIFTHKELDLPKDSFVFCCFPF